MEVQTPSLILSSCRYLSQTHPTAHWPNVCTRPLLQECFNSLYGATFFPTYAETIGYTPGEPYDVSASPSQTVKMLSAAAKEEGVWLLGGASHFIQPFLRLSEDHLRAGTIPEREAGTGNLYITCTVYSPKGR